MLKPSNEILSKSNLAALTTMTTIINQLLFPHELSRLEQLRITPSRRFAGKQRGERISRQKGISVEFSDYRDYTVGDDLRHLDWNILARLDRPTIRTYQDEDDLAVYILLDSSASMAFGHPSKFEVAQKLAASVGFVGLCGQDRVTPSVLGEPSAARSIRGRGSLNALTRLAQFAQPNGSSAFSTGVKAFLNIRGNRPGMVFCITDALDPAAPSAIRSIGARGHDLVVVQVLSNVDVEPEVEGDLRLIDSESAPSVDITASAEAVAIYKENLAAHNAAVQAAATSAGGRYLRVDTSMTLIDVMTYDLRNIGVIE